MHIAGEEALQALRSANEALVELSSETSPNSRSGKGRAGAAQRAVRHILPQSICWSLTRPQVQTATMWLLEVSCLLCCDGLHFA